jgi:hypothetical protein
MPQILNPDIYKKAKEDADKKYKKPSAYKSMYIVKRYKELGGEYADDGKPKNLDRWRKEEWKDIAGLDYPVYRPTKRISKKTPLTPLEIEPENLVKQSILKQVVKGSKNLPAFTRKIGGKRTANEIKNFLDASYQKKPPTKLNGFNLDKDLSTDTAKVYYNPNSNEAVVSHRGTEGILDWGNNLAYALGYYDYTTRYKKGKSVQDKAETKYGKQNISTLGHSQGAILARKLGADTKEVINVNPVWMGEKPYKNEYNIRSSTDIVSGLYQPISKARSLLYPKYTLKHDILVPSKSSSDFLGEHSYKILDRLGDKEIGVGAKSEATAKSEKIKNKISNNDIMKGGRRFSLDEKIKQLVYIGLPQDAVALLLHSGNIENVWNTYISGDDMKPILSNILSSLEPRKIQKNTFELNVGLNEFDDADADELVGGKNFYGYTNIGTNPRGVIGGTSLLKSISKGVSKSIKKVDKTFKPISKGLDKVSKGFDTGVEYANPMMWALKDKKSLKAMKKAGDITHDYLLPAVVSAGKPMYDATAMTASTMLTGNPVLGKAIGDTLWNEMVVKTGSDPRQNQKSKELGELSAFTGQALSASLGGMRNTVKGALEKMMMEFKADNPRARVKDLNAFAERILKNKKLFSDKAIFASKVHLGF